MACCCTSIHSISNIFNIKEGVSFSSDLKFSILPGLPRSFSKILLPTKKHCCCHYCAMWHIQCDISTLLSYSSMIIQFCQSDHPCRAISSQQQGTSAIRISNDKHILEGNVKVSLSNFFILQMWFSFTQLQNSGKPKPIIQILPIVSHAVILHWVCNMLMTPT